MRYLTGQGLEQFDLEEAVAGEFLRGFGNGTEDSESSGTTYEPPPKKPITWLGPPMRPVYQVKKVTPTPTRKPVYLPKPPRAPSMPNKPAMPDAPKDYWSALSASIAPVEYYARKEYTTAKLVNPFEPSQSVTMTFPTSSSVKKVYSGSAEAAAAAKEADSQKGQQFPKLVRTTVRAFVEQRDQQPQILEPELTSDELAIKLYQDNENTIDTLIKEMSRLGAMRKWPEKFGISPEKRGDLARKHESVSAACEQAARDRVRFGLRAWVAEVKIGVKDAFLEAVNNFSWSSSRKKR